MVEKTPYHGKIKLEWETRPMRLRLAKWHVRIKKALFFFFAAAVVIVLTWGPGWLFGSRLFFGVGFLLGAMLLMIGLYLGFRARVGACPYCQEIVGEKLHDLGSSDSYHMVHCIHCYELLVSDESALRVMLPGEDEYYLDSFPAPVFQGAVWPDECIVCGIEVQDYGGFEEDEIEQASSQLVIQRLSFSLGKEENIPYCNEHHGMLPLRIEGEKAFIEFPELTMQRRYLAVNRGKDVMTLKS